MMDRIETERVVALQMKSYRMLRWLADTVSSGRLDFNTLHGSMEFAEAAREWIGRNMASIPSDTRPDTDDLDEFAHLFASYLNTSFEIVQQPVTRYVVKCTCSCCTMLAQSDRLKLRTVNVKAHEKAFLLKQTYLIALATEIGGTSTVAQKVLDETSLAPAVSYATYGRELLRRSEFASQGIGVLVLWREIAWSDGKIKKGFVLSAEAILSAEMSIVERMGVL